MNNKLKAAIRDTILYHCPKKIAHAYIYKRAHGKRLNFSNPLTYDEKIHWLMVYKYDKTFGYYADKIQVRQYVKSVGLESILIPLEGKGIYNTPEEIDFSDLSEKYILKTNHGSGESFYYISDGSHENDKDRIVEKLNKALKKNFAKHYCQYHYAAIKPALICEKYLVTEGQNHLTDYKVLCSYGNPIAVLVCRDRNNGRDYYSPEWQYLEYVKTEFRSGILEEKPKVLDEML